MAEPNDKMKKASSDDLTSIRGIDRGLAERLHAIGVTTFVQIANWDRLTLLEVSTALNLGRKISRENWVEQAKLLANTASVHDLDRGPPAKSAGADRPPPAQPQIAMTKRASASETPRASLIERLNSQTAGNVRSVNQGSSGAGPGFSDLVARADRYHNVHARATSTPDSSAPDARPGASAETPPNQNSVSTAKPAADATTAPTAPPPIDGARHAAYHGPKEQAQVQIVRRKSQADAVQQSPKTQPAHPVGQFFKSLKRQ